MNSYTVGYYVVKRDYDTVDIPTFRPCPNGYTTIVPKYNPLLKYIPYTFEVRPYGYIAKPAVGTVAVESGGISLGYLDNREPYKIADLASNGSMLYTEYSTFYINEGDFFLGIDLDKTPSAKGIINVGWGLSFEEEKLKVLNGASEDYLVKYSELDSIIRKITEAIQDVNTAIPTMSSSPTVGSKLADIISLLPTLRTTNET